MTQIKEGLEKQPSPELLSLIKAAAQSLLGFGELWTSIKKKGHDEGFSERELQDILRPLLKPQLNKDQIYYLFNKEEYKDKNKKYYEGLKNRINTTEPLKKDTEHLELPDPISLPLKQSIVDQDDEEEGPTELELANIKIAQLEDALHKTEQFKPASKLEGQVETFPPLHDEEVFEYLRKRDNGVNIYYFDNYGRELFSNRILSQLRNSGVKTFKRLYFEV